MTNFKGCTCSVCNQPFKNGDDIVVCPECGAPYHRACYAKEGHCVYEAQHGNGFEYQAPSTAGLGNRCGNCGAENPQGNLFCENCGAALGEAAQSKATANGPQLAQPTQTPVGSVSGAQYQNPAMQEFQHMINEATIGKEYDGISSADWTQYIGKSAPYYLFQFAHMDQSGRKNSICWSAFFFAPLYFAYRKMWSWLAASLFGSLIANLPSYLYMLQTLGINIGFTISDNTMNLLLVVGVVLRFALGVYFGMFAFSLYRQHGAKKLHALKSSALDDSEYQATLARTGGPSIAAVVALVVVSLVLTYAFIFWIGPEKIMSLYGMYY